MKLLDFLKILLLILVSSIIGYIFFVTTSDIKDVYTCTGNICQWNEKDLHNRKMTYMGEDWLPYIDNRQAVKIVPEKFSKGIFRNMKTYSLKSEYHYERNGCTTWEKVNENTPLFNSQYLLYKNAQRDLDLIKSGKDITIVKYDTLLISKIISIGLIILNFIIIIFRKLKSEIQEFNDII